jgi:predicted nucleic acid-binding protein
MGWLTKLYGTTVGLDTAPLIYFIERNPTYLSRVYPFFEALDRGDIQAVASTLTLTEVLVHPYKRGDRYLAGQYSNILLSHRYLQTLAVSPEIAIEAAKIRASYGLKTPDSIQLATALTCGATSFFSNDSGLPAIPGLDLILLDQITGTP